MKESITKFDLEAAFKALDEIEAPRAGKVRANKPALTEIFSRKTKFDALMEEYYDISSNAGLEDAKEAREAEIAQAKLARIEKIVDLEADSAEDLLTSYVGKFIMQCPQCMTLFYKDPEDVEASEEDPSTVNVNEVCQHCGNESGYSLIGKVGEAEAEETPAESTEEMPEENLDLESGESDETTAEESNEDEGEESLDDVLAGLEDIELDLEEEPAEEEKKEESFGVHSGETLVEELDDKDLDDKLDAHNEYIEYLRAAIADEEAKLEKATNEQVKVAIQRNIDAFKADLEKALPDAVKNGVAEEEVPVADEMEETAEEESTEGTPGETDINESLTESLHEDNDASEDEFDQLLNSPEFQKPISDSEVRAMLASEDDSREKEESLENIFSEVDELEEENLESMISDSLVEMYKNVAGFRLKECSCTNNKFMVEGVIHFTSGNTRKTTYTFNEAFIDSNKVTLRGLNEKLGVDKHFYIEGHTEDKTFITESLKITKD